MTAYRHLGLSLQLQNAIKLDWKCSKEETNTYCQRNLGNEFKIIVNELELYVNDIKINIKIA